MSKKPFRLERLLRVRRSELDRAAGALASAVEELVAAREEVDAAARDRRKAELARQQRLAAGASAGECAALSFSIESGRLGEHRAHELESASAQRFEKARLVLLTARTRVRALEKLRDRIARAESAELDRIDQLALDEIGARGAIDRGVGSR